MVSVGSGWHELLVDHAGASSRYWLVLPDGRAIADPASRCQPDGVWGPSEVVDLDRYQWRRPGWEGRPWHEAVIYELHVGAFTEAGSFKAAIERLPHWRHGHHRHRTIPSAVLRRPQLGHDGVLPFFRPAAGRPEICRPWLSAHDWESWFARVVYNHFGPREPPAGSGSGLFSRSSETPWARASIRGERRAPTHLKPAFTGAAHRWMASPGRCMRLRRTVRAHHRDLR